MIAFTAAIIMAIQSAVYIVRNRKGTHVRTGFEGYLIATLLLTAAMALDKVAP